jgi:GMP synthase-like glutamine amidotransferase
VVVEAETFSKDGCRRRWPRGTRSCWRRYSGPRSCRQRSASTPSGWCATWRPWEKARFFPAPTRSRAHLAAHAGSRGRGGGHVQRRLRRPSREAPDRSAGPGGALSAAASPARHRPRHDSPEEQGAREIARCWQGSWSVRAAMLRPGDGPDQPRATTSMPWSMGSKASVRDDHGWLRDLAAWLAPIVRGEVCRPLLGICFGHQLWRSSRGARVDWTHADRREERGFPGDHAGGGRSSPGTHRLRVVASHYEAVQEVPAGSESRLSGPTCPSTASSTWSSRSSPGSSTRGTRPLRDQGRPRPGGDRRRLVRTRGACSPRSAPRQRTVQR